MSHLDTSVLMTAFATALDTIDGLRVADGWPDQVNAPVAFPVLGSPAIEDSTLDSGFTVNVDVIVLVSQGGSLGRAQRALNDYADTSGATSIRAAVLGMTTYGPAITSRGVSGYTVFDHIGADYLGMIHRFAVYL